MKRHLLTLSFVLLLIGCGTQNEPTFRLTVSSNPREGGSVSPSDDVFDKNEDVILAATPSTGWRFVRWEGDWSGTSNPVTIRMSRDYTIVGIFERRDYPLTITIEGEGTVTEKLVTPQTTDYQFQAIVELTPIPAEGWTFIGWAGDLSGNESPKQIFIDAEKSVTARFGNLYSLHSNGITILCPNTSVGERGVLNGVSYETVDRDLLIQRKNEGADLTRVCTSLVTRMDSLFAGTTFNQPIGNWDVSSVTEMKWMFYKSTFNQNISDWDVSSVTNMTSMFGETPFNQPISNWDVSSVKSFNGVFARSAFDQPIGNWDVSSATDMGMMFTQSVFNQSIGNWNTASVINMSRMFESSQFNQSIGNWNVSSVLDMSGMFNNSKLNQPIGNWDVSSVTNMEQMFWNSEFNQPIGNWDVSRVSNMRLMFSSSQFDQVIRDWNVSSVLSMGSMFSGSNFNQPIGDWDVRSVTDMNRMFYFSKFNQSIKRWCVLKISSEPTNFSTNSQLTPENKPIWGTCPNN